MTVALASAKARIAALAVLTSGCASLTQIAATDNTATAELRSADGQVVGTAALTEVSDGVRIVLDLRGMPPGARAVHLHEVGKCEPPAFASAGGHLNPDGKQHGLLNSAGPHAGDLPNITIGPDGAGHLETMNARISLRSGAASLLDADGSALVVHATADDFTTDPAGGSGARIACGVVVKASPR